MLWHCDCGWEGEHPSITDASVEVELTPGIVGIDRLHKPICPRCFADLSFARRVERTEVA